MANESFSFEEAAGLTPKPQPSGAADPGGFSLEEALGKPAQASPGFIPTIKRTGGQMLTTAATAAEDVVGPNAVTRAVHETGQGIIDRNPAGIRSLRDLVDSPWLAVKESVGQFAPQIAAAAAGGAVGARAGAALGSVAGPAGAATGGAIGGVAGSLLPIFTQEYGGIRQEQKESGQEDKTRALAAAIPATALERVGMGKALNVLKGVPGGAAGTVLKEVGKGVLKEGATEGAQNVIEQWGAFKDPTKAENLEDTALSAAMGGIGGGVMGAGAGAMDGARRRAQERAEVQVRQSAEAAAADAQAKADATREEQRAAAGQVATDAAAVRSGVLADEEGVQPEVPQTTPPDGRAVLESRRAADRAQASPDDEIYQSTGADVRTAPPVAAEPLQQAAEPVESDPRTPSQRMGINPDAGPLSRNVATAIDSAAVQDAQFLGATDRDLQVRRTGPGVADESNVIDVEGRVVEDRALGMPRRLTTDTPEGLPVAAGVAEPINRTGQPLQLNMAHALRAQADQAGMQAAVVRHASGRGYDVVPRLPAPAVVAAPGGAPFSTPAAAQAELQRQQLGATHELAPAGGDSSLGFVLQKKGQNTASSLEGQAQVAINSGANRAGNWRANALQANRVARELGIDPKGKRLAQVVAEIDAADAQRAGVRQDGADLAAGQIDREWSAFAPETGTLGVPRAEMPQIKAEHRGALVNFLKARGIDSRPGEVPANDLKPTQAEFAPGKVEKARAFQGGDRSILVSSDGYVVDGHHQWLAKRANGEPVKVIRLQAPIREVLAQTAEFPSTASGRGAAQPNSTSLAALHEANGPYLPSAATRTPEGRWQPAVKVGQGGGRPIDGAPTFSDAGSAAAWAGYEQAKGRDGADVQALQRLQDSIPSRIGSVGVATPTVNTTQNAPELVAAGAYEPSAGSASGPSQGGGQQQDRPPRSGPRSEADSNRVSNAINKAPAAINSGANPGAVGSGAAPRSTTRIEDFGETLQGARKMLYAEAYADGMAKAKELDIKAHPLSKTWPEPDYQKLLEGGAPLQAVSLARAMREAVPNKPQSSWKLKGWSARVESLRDFAEDILSGAADAQTVMRDAQDAGVREVTNKAALYEAMGHERSLKGIDLSAGRYSMYDRVEYNPPRTIWSVSREAKGGAFGNWPRELAKGDTREAAIAAFKKRAEELLAEERAPAKGAAFEIYGKRAGGAREFFIGKKIGRNVAELKAGFADIKAARQYLADNQTGLENLLDKYKAIPPVRSGTNAPRIGEDYRKGADVTPEQFQEEFGFRGVQFGNYVEGGRRQQDLNQAYDALMDLAAVLNLPPRALSLGGRLGLAFGARGTGGTDAAAAHYESGNVVINLTKREGAGSLAHEWWHGLDNYFSRERGDGGTYMTERDQGGEGVREEMRAAFREVNGAINRTRMQERSRKLDDRRTKDYWTTKPEMSARAFESYVIAKLQDQNAGNDYLANVVGASAFALEGGYPYPTAGELPVIRGAFDGFFETVETRQGEGGATVLYNTSDSKPPARGLSLEEAQQAVQQALAGMSNPPPIDIVTRSQELGVDAPDGVMGAAIPGEGRIVIVASAHGSADAVIETVFHEMFHLGVRNVLPAPDYVQTMLDLAKRDARIQAYANQWKKEAADAPQQLQALRDRGHTGSELRAQYEALAIEEGLAVMAQELKAKKQAGTGLGLRVRALAGWFASVADRMGMTGLADRIRKMTYNEAERFVLKAIEHAGRAPLSQDRPDGARFRAAGQTDTPTFQNWFGSSKAVDDAGQPLRVFHGTGGDFSAFSRDRAGAATGAANTGMGFFFTDNAEVAGNYARMSRDAQAIMPVYLSLQNPVRLEAKNMMEADKLLMSGLKPENDGAIIRVAMRDGGTQTVYMARQPGQIKSATGNQGTFDASNPDIRYRSPGENSTAGRVGDVLKSVTVANLKQQAGYKAADYRGLGLQLLGRRQLVDVYGNTIPELRSYSDLMARMDADKNEAGSGADQLAQDWAQLPDERALAELMHDATLAQIDPSKDFVEGDNKTDWIRLRAKHQALTPAAKEVYARARDTYRQHMRDVRSAIKERIERTEISSERKAAMLKRMDDEFFGHIKGVYFPLARFGQYVVVVKDAEGKVANVSRAETMAEADATRRQLVTAFPAGKGFAVGKVLKAKDFVAERDSVGRGFMEQLYGVLDKQGMDTKQRAELEDALGQLYLSSLPDLSWAKHGIHRKGTAGFSQDARRAFAQNVFHGASYLAKLRYGDRLQDELGEMQRRVDAGSTDSGFDSVKAQQVVDEMVKRHDAAMNPKTNGLSTMLTSLGFIFHLGLSPASAMVNLTQTALVAYPVMGAKWGFKKASTALLKASGEAARGKNDITGSLSAEEKAAFDEAVRSGVIDVTMAHDLAGIAQGEDQNVSYKLRPVMRAASWMFHHAEKFNRQVTFVAAYRLAREAGAGDKAAYEQAVQATYDGHFDYSSNNRPRAMQGNVARVVLLFKQYGQNMVYTLMRNAHQSLKGASPQERAQARKALGGLLTMHGLAAGALGLPMVTTLLSAASMLGGDDDEPWDAQVALQNMLADTFGQKPAEVLAHGLSRLTPWDISGRVGLDKLIFPDVQEGLEGQRLGESAMAAALGPVAGIGINVLKGVQDMIEGRYARGLEAMAPSVLRGPLKAWRYETEGVKDKSGIVVQDEVDAASLLGQAAGFSPSSVRNSFEGKSAIVQHDRVLQARRSALVEQFAMAAMAGDEEGKAEAREAAAKFNEKNPNRRILPMQLAQSVNMRQKRIREAQEGVYLPGKRRDALEAGRFAVQD
ncbi:PLxRFG domain-containing protein [Simplicispira piscis]